jgi:hypothetical protein
VEALESPLLRTLGVRHAFSLRGIDPATPAGRDDIAARLGCATDELYECSQVHAADVVHVAPGRDVTTVRRIEADALVATGGAAIGVRVADCVAVLVADPATGAVAAIHAGWRGTVRGVVARAIERLRAQGGAPETFCASLFPHIRVCCFEVGDDVARQIADASPARDVIVRGATRPHVDLARVLVAQLQEAGLARERIDEVPGCTKCDAARFHSYRRDGANAGRHLAAIASR